MIQKMTLLYLMQLNNFRELDYEHQLFKCYFSDQQQEEHSIFEDALRINFPFQQEKQWILQQIHCECLNNKKPISERTIILSEHLQFQKIVYNCLSCQAFFFLLC